MTEAAILDGILDREGGFRAAVQRPDGTWDPDTMYGVTAATLGEWRRLDRPATREEVQNLDPEEARAIYQSIYIDEPGFTPANVTDHDLRLQLIDFGVNSGPARATRWLQRCLRIAADGKLGPQTIWAIKECGRLYCGYGLLNDALVAARSYMIDQAVDSGSMRKADEEGVESRALSFFLAKP